MTTTLRPGDFTERGDFVDCNGAIQKFGAFYMAMGREELAKKHGWQPVMPCHNGQFIAEKKPPSEQP